MSSLPLQQEAARELLIRRAARSDILHYTNAIEIPGRPVGEDPDTEFFLPIETTLAIHHRLLLKKLDEVSNTPHGRMMVFMPPGSAKSTYASVVFPSRYLGAQENRKLILSSYGDDLARKMGRRTRSILRQKRYRGIFGTELTPDSQAAQEFALMNGSEYMSCGILSGITGNRANGIIIDDPIKGREQANSETIRNKTFDAYEDDLKTRLIPGGWIVLIQCMTGDTPILMETGYEKPLRDIRPGDRVATYENGSISSSTVRNWANQGPDLVYEIRMKSGIIVKANARHPFLVEEDGEEKWQRTATLKKGNFILRVIGENGKTLNAPQKGVTSQQNAKACACRITTNTDGKPAFGRLQSILNQGVKRICAIATALVSRSTNVSWLSKEEFAQSVNSRPQSRILGRIGTGNCASIIATIAKKLEGFSATIATLLSGMGRPKKYFAPQPNTYEIAKDEVVEITESGIEDVFDIEVERTENFIANGLVSHNTRWHQDDLAGRILPHDWNGQSGKILCRDGNEWEVICLQARCEIDNDPLGRAQGEYLWPEWFDRKHWAQFESNDRTWSALYQQRPSPADGEIFKPDAIQVIDAIPAVPIRWVRGWDFASTTTGDYTAGGKLGILPDGRFIIGDVVRLRRGPHERDAAILNTASQDGSAVQIDIPQDPGQAGKTQVLYMTRELAGYTVHSSPESGDKVTRAEPFAAQVNVGNVLMVRGAWNTELINEMRMFPNGTNDDQIDGLSRSFARLIGAKQWAF